MFNRDVGLVGCLFGFVCRVDEGVGVCLVFNSGIISSRFGVGW